MNVDVKTSDFYFVRYETAMDIDRLGVSTVVRWCICRLAKPTTLPGTSTLLLAAVRKTVYSLEESVCVLPVPPVRSL